jgi:hypothetical protein
VGTTINNDKRSKYSNSPLALYIIPQERLRCTASTGQVVIHGNLRINAHNREVAMTPDSRPTIYSKNLSLQTTTLIQNVACISSKNVSVTIKRTRL